MIRINVIKTLIAKKVTSGIGSLTHLCESVQIIKKKKKYF